MRRIIPTHYIIIIIIDLEQQSNHVRMCVSKLDAKWVYNIRNNHTTCSNEYANYYRCVIIHNKIIIIL